MRDVLEDYDPSTDAEVTKQQPPPIEDDPINRKTVMDLTIDELDTMIEGIQERRLVIIRKLEEQAQVKANMADMNRYIAFQKKVVLVRKKYDAVTKALAVIEGEINKLRALRLAIEE